ncbi:MAG: Ldh family oxidoreductase, partial [Dehalococcoidia bacterium]
MTRRQTAVTLAGAPPGDIAVGMDGLLRFGEDILTKAGAAPEHARLTTEILLEADLRGIESHGVAHLVDFYVRAIQGGLIDTRAKVEVVRETASAATVDAGGGLGFVAGHQAMQRAITKARETGVGIVTVGNSTHYGAGTYYGMLALEHNMIGLSMTTGGRLMAAPGALAKTIGTNVISCSAPTPRGFPYVLDMATTVVAAGKLEIAERRGRPIPEGWAIDGQGNPLTDPKRRNVDAMLLPLGGSEATSSYKGFGLALMVDVLTGALSGFVTSAEMERWRAAHAFGALRIDAFQPLDEFLNRMGGMIDAIK